MLGSQTTLATKVDAREAIQRTLGRTIADLEARMRDEVGRLRDDTTNTCRALQVTGVADCALAVNTMCSRSPFLGCWPQSDAEALAGDMESLRTWCHQLDASHRNHVADTTQRLAHVEAGPDLGPILAAVQQIEDRMGNMGRAQDSATTRLEAGLGRLNSDYADVASRIENADATIQALRRAVREASRQRAEVVVTCERAGHCKVASGSQLGFVASRSTMRPWSGRRPCLLPPSTSPRPFQRSRWLRRCPQGRGHTTQVRSSKGG